MMRVAHVIALAVVTLALARHASAQDAGCAPPNWAGRVLSLAADGAAPPSPSGPFVLRGGRSVALREGDPLCIGEAVSNPVGSGRIAEIMLAGGSHLNIRPGGSRTIPPPSAVSWVADTAQRFGRVFSADQWVRPAAVRGLAIGSATPALASRVKAVRGWGPLVVIWPRGDELEPQWRVTVRSASGASTWSQQTNVVWIDTQRACADGCQVRVEPQRGPLAINVTIDVVPDADAPRPAGAPPTGAAAPEIALEGAWLVDKANDAAWRLQGAAMLWRAACDLPPLLGRLHDLYGDFEDALVCRPPPNGPPSV